MKGAFGEDLKPVKISRFKVGDKFMTPKGIGVITNITLDRVAEIITTDGSYDWKLIRTGKDSEYLNIDRGIFAKNKIN